MHACHVAFLDYLVFFLGEEDGMLRFYDDALAHSLEQNWMGLWMLGFYCSLFGISYKALSAHQGSQVHDDWTCLSAVLKHLIQRPNGGRSIINAMISPSACISHATCLMIVNDG